MNTEHNNTVHSPGLFIKNFPEPFYYNIAVYLKNSLLNSSVLYGKQNDRSVGPFSQPEAVGATTENV